MLGFLAIPKLGKIVLITGTIVLIFGTGWKINGWRLEARIASLQASHAKAYAEAQEQARAKETALNNDLATLRKTKDAQIKTINDRLAVALDGLRDRPERASDSMPTDSGIGLKYRKGCYPSELFREDAESFVRFAEETEKLKESLKYCIAQYNLVRKNFLFD